MENGGHEKEQTSLKKEPLMQSAGE